MKSIFQYLLILFSVALIIPACVDQEFDEPPAEGVDPDITPNATIADILALHTLGQYESVEDDLIFDAVVVADDETGNFYQSLIVQDETGGILLRMGGNELHNEYRIGRRVFVNCKGLVLGDYNGVVQLGGGFEREPDGTIISVLQIPEPLFGEYIIKGKWNQFMAPTPKKVGELTQADVSTLIQLTDVQFADNEVGETLAIDSISAQGNRVQASVNRQLLSCAGDAPIVVRTSGYSNFALETCPAGSGNVVGIYSVFGDTKQFVIRSIDDLDLPNARCEPQALSLGNLRISYSGSSSFLPNGTILKGEVISDRAGGNINSQNMVIQDETGGIVVRFDGTHSFNLGDVVEIDASGAEFSEYRNLLQVSGVDNLKAKTISEALNVTPYELTIAELLDDYEKYESSLVLLKNVTLAGAGTFEGTITVSDGTGSLPHFTYFSASFSSNPLPAGEVNMTAIASTFNDPQLNMRNGSDVSGGGSGGDAELKDISLVRSLYTGSAATLSENYKIKGVVISDADNDNITALNIVVQDGSAGIVVRFSDSHSFNLGDEIEVVIKGAEISEYNGLMQLNGVAISNATKLGSGALPTPREATVSEILNNLESWESTLVKIVDASLGGGATYGDNITVNDGTGTIPLYTRSAASFATSSIPSEVIDMTAIVSQFNDAQLNIRNLDDVGGGGSGTDPVLEDISNIKSLFSGSSTTVSGNLKIKGVVISDAANMNTHGLNMIMQDASGGIVVRFDGDHGFKAGDEVEVLVKGMELSEYNGLLQVNAVPLANATKLGSGVSVTPRAATVQEILDNSEAWESTLVVITDASITGGSTYAGNLSVSDGTASIPMYTRADATFASASVPSSLVKLTAMVGDFNAAQLNIRNLDDVQP